MSGERDLILDLVQIAASNEPLFKAQEELALKPLDIIGADKCMLCTLDPTMITFEVTLARGFLGEGSFREGDRYDFSDTPRYIRDAVTTRSIIHVEDVQADPRVDRERASLEGYASLTSLPMVAYGSTMGVLTYYYPRRKSLSAEEERFLRGISALLAMRIQKTKADEEYEALSEELEANSITCPLTGLYNKRFFLKRLQEEVSRSQRYGRPLSLLIFDIDDLAEINETYGGPIGDAVLAEFARLLSHAVRISDVAARFGGDEFALLAVETGLNGARVIGERIVALIGERKIYEFDVEISVTCCVGISSMPSPWIFSGDQLIEAALHALSEAKRRGRSNVEVARAAR
jgi:diguanylate cyclase (GGDEF)-like protein